VIKKINAVKKITQTTGAISEHKHSEIKRFSNSKDSVTVLVVNKFSGLR